MHAAPWAPLPCARWLSGWLQVLDGIKKRPYDLLEFTNTEFDRDILEFSVNINDLEIVLQVLCGGG